ncbi:MAG: MgtC/SapB family protein, partial [Elusimicrobia bacterium]|nr:MgtC/SapB family protein [Elusimicrobiota bacterium]
MDQAVVLSQTIALTQLAIACLLGGVIGFERQVKQKPAGLKTHAFVAGASALFVILSLILVKQAGIVIGPDILKADPIRIFQAIILGISFIGAGTIIRDGEGHIQGLTTASTLLLSVTVGIAVALEQYVLALGITF